MSRMLLCSCAARYPFGACQNRIPTLLLMQLCLPVCTVVLLYPCSSVGGSCCSLLPCPAQDPNCNTCLVTKATWAGPLIPYGVGVRGTWPAFSTSCGYKFKCADRNICGSNGTCVDQPLPQVLGLPQLPAFAFCGCHNGYTGTFCEIPPPAGKRVIITAGRKFVRPRHCSFKHLSAADGTNIRKFMCALTTTSILKCLVIMSMLTEATLLV